MKCPVDKIDMIVVEHRKIELDYCLKCAGVWLDSGELDLLVSVFRSEGAKLDNTSLFTPHEAQTNEGRRRCPLCGRRMNKVWLGKEPRVLIDSCPNGDGLWFDGGELQQVLKEVQTGGNDASELLSFLGSAFAPTHTHHGKH